MKKFNFYEVRDIRELLRRLDTDTDDENEYRLKPLHKKNKEILMFTKKDFSHFCDYNSAHIVGNIRYRQKTYTNYADTDKLIQEKQKKKIIAQNKLRIDKDFKFYDVRRPKESHAVGYAWVGGNKFLRVTSFNWLLLLIPLLLALCILFLFSNCPDEDIKMPFAPTEDVSSPEGETPEQRLCYFPPFDETTTLTSDNKNIRLINHIKNEDFNLTYEISVDGERLKLRDIQKGEDEENQYNIGLIAPGDTVYYDLWSRLDAGTYELKCTGYAYDKETNAKMDGKGYLYTTLIIEK